MMDGNVVELPANYVALLGPVPTAELIFLALGIQESVCTAPHPPQRAAALLAVIEILRVEILRRENENNMKEEASS